MSSSNGARVARVRRALFVRRLRLAAAAVDARIDVDIALDARIGRRIKIEIAPGTHNRLEVGIGSRLRDDCSIHLDGGTIRIGPWCDIRTGVLLNVSGELVLEGQNILSWGTIVHCAGRTVLGPLVGASDSVAIVDSTHYFTTPDVAFHHNIKPGEVTIGRNSWLGSKSTITRGSRIGAYCIVGANSLVKGEVPDGHVAVGVPAQLRPTTLPWEQEPDDER